MTVEGLGKKQPTPEDLVSLITFDQGDTWSRIQGPATDEEGNEFLSCQGNAEEECSLHISQQFSKK